MARYSLSFRPAAKRELEKLSRQAQERLAPVIDALADDPRPSGVAKMQGSGDLYRVRSGNYRIVYEIHDTALVVVVVTVGNRRDVYR